MGEATTNILSPFNPPVRTCCVEKNQTSTKVQFPLLVFSIEFRFPQNFTTQSFFIFSYLISIQAQTYRLSAPKLWKLIRHGWRSLSAPVSHVGELEIPDRGLLIQEMTSFRGESVHCLFARSYDDNLFILSAFGKKKKNSREFPTNWSLCQQMHNFALSKCLKMTQVFHSNPPCVMVTVTFWMEIAQMWSFCSTSFHHGNIFGLSCLPFKTSSSSFQHIPTHWIHRISQQRE